MVTVWIAPPAKWSAFAYCYWELCAARQALTLVERERAIQIPLPSDPDAHAQAQARPVGTNDLVRMVHPFNASIYDNDEQWRAEDDLEVPGHMKHSLVFVHYMHCVYNPLHGKALMWIPTAGGGRRRAGQNAHDA